MKDTKIIITDAEIAEETKKIKENSDRVIRWAKNTICSSHAQERGMRQLTSVIAYMKCGLTPPALAPEGIAVLVLSAAGEASLPGWVKVVMERGRITLIIPGRAASFKLPSQIFDKNNFDKNKEKNKKG